MRLFSPEWGIIPFYKVLLCCLSQELLPLLCNDSRLRRIAGTCAGVLRRSSGEWRREERRGRQRAAQPGPFCAESALPVRPQLERGLRFKGRVCVCVCVTRTAAAGAFTNVKRLSVFVSSGAQVMRSKLKIHCTASVCLSSVCVCVHRERERECTKRGNKNRGPMGRRRSVGLGTRALPSPLYLPSLCSFSPPSKMKCGPHVEPPNRGSQACFL